MTTRPCVEHGRNCQPWQHVVPKEKLREYALGPIRLDVPVPADLHKRDAITWLYAEGLHGLPFYAMRVVPIGAVAKWVFAESDGQFIAKACAAVGRYSSATLVWVVM